MTSASFKTGIVATGVAALAVWLTVEYNSYKTLRIENAALHQQISQMGQMEQPQPSQMVASSANSEDLEKLRREHSELLSLRGEIGNLRDTVETKNAELETVRTENAKMLAVSNALVGADWSVTRSNLMTLKQIGVACRLYAANNGGSLPTNIAEVQDDTYVEFPHGAGPNSFEFFDYGQPLTTNTPGYYFLARETQAILYPSGQWKRTYLLADGSVQIGTSDDGNFDSWEQQWIQQQSQLADQQSGMNNSP